MKVLFLISALSLLLFAFALTHGFAADLAIYSGATNPGWISQDAAIANAETITNDDLMKAIFESIENYGDGDEVGYDSALGTWMQAHTGNGQQDVFIAASGTAPSAVYQFPNVDPDGSNIENFVEDGNVFINVADWILYMSYEGGSRSADNAADGAANVFDISWIHFWPPGGHGSPSVPMVPTEVGEKYIPSLEAFGSDRPWHLQQFLGSDWEVTAFAVAKNDPYSADPAVAVNKTYGGIIAAMWQKAQPNWIGTDPRGIGVIEFVANWLTEHGNITTPVNTQGNPATAWEKIKPTNGGSDGIDTVQEAENKVHLVYFLPRDRSAQPDIETKLNALIKSTQQFYANQMQSHGYGNKTFTFETDANGKAIVHHLDGQFTNAYYQNQTYNKVLAEVSKRFNSTRHVYLVAADVNSESLGIGNQTTLCGVTRSSGHSKDSQTWWKGLGGMTVIPASGNCFNPQITAHELGHAFGLMHDFRDDAYVMGYGTLLRLSDCAAEWLSVHPFLNTNPIGFNQNTTIDMRSHREGGFRFQITDTDGLHQVQFLIPAIAGDPSPGVKLHSCLALNGKTSSTVEFVASELIETSGEEVTLQVIDIHGNITYRKFSVTTSTPITDIDSITTVSISPSLVQSPAIGQQLTLTLHIADGAAVAGYQATVQFDAAALRYIASTNGDYLSEGAFFVPPAVSGNTVRLAATTFSGESNGDGTLATLTFEVFAVQPSTLILSEVILSDNNSQLSYPDVENGEVVIPAHVIGDVNGDGVVNIQDLVKVASSFGQMGQTAADVTGDGVVNIADLVKVAGIIGTGTAAPTALPQALELLTAAEVQLWLTQAQQSKLTDPTSQRGILVLKQLLAMLMPKETALLPNYPNPFNPETWIPYHLASPSVVQITIYNARGTIVHQMDLGHQREGYYTSRNRAAYWDGMNDVGESVASGIYFYQLRTDKASLLRKMVILK